MQAGGHAVFTGGYTTAAASTINVTGAGSTFSTTANLSFDGGSSMHITADADVSSGGSVVLTHPTAR